MDSGGNTVNITAEQILDALKMTFMGTFDAHNGTWGVLTDLVYVDLGASKSNSRDFTIGNIGLPVGTTADLDLDYKVTSWTIAGEYRVLSDPSLTLDLLAGTRLLDQRQRLRWTSRRSWSRRLRPMRHGGDCRALRWRLPRPVMWQRT